MTSIALIRAGHLTEGTDRISECVRNWRASNAHIAIPYMQCVLAHGLARIGDLESALRTVDEAIEQVERPGWQERCQFAELLRVKGWILDLQGKSDQAEEYLHAAVDFARKQQAKSWELRSSITLAELLARRGQRDAARKLLAPIYNWFTEGFETKDLKEAKALLGELA